MGCMESKDEVIQVDNAGVQRNRTAKISHLNGTKSYTYTFNEAEVPENYTAPQITVTDTYDIGPSNNQHYV